MKTKARKLLASFTAAAMAVMCAVIAVPKLEVSADEVGETSEPLYRFEWSWSGDNSALTEIEDITAVKKISANIQYASGTNQYANGVVTSNGYGTNGEDGWRQTAFGTNGQAVELTAGTAADVEVEVADITNYLEFGVVEYGGGRLTVNSIKFYDENDDVLQTLNVGKSFGTPYSGNNSDIVGWDEETGKTITKIRANVIYPEGTNQYANGAVTSNSYGTNGEDGWRQTAFGTGNQTVKLTAGTAADVEVEVANITNYLQFGVVEYGGALTVNSIKFLNAAEEVVYQLPAAGASGDGDDDGETPVSAVIWEGSFDTNGWGSWLGNNDGTLTPDKFASLNQGDTVKFSFDVTGENAAIKILDGSWTGVTSIDYVNESDCYILVSGSSYTFTVNAADTANLKEGGMVFGGTGVTLTKIEIISASSGSGDDGDGDGDGDGDDGDSGNNTPAGESTTVWTGSFDTGTGESWTNWLMCYGPGELTPDKFASLNTGDSIKVTYNVTGEKPVLKVIDIVNGEWAAATSISYADAGESVYPGSDSSSYVFTVNAADTANIKASGLILGGNDIVITKVEIISAGSGSGSGSESGSGSVTPSTPSEGNASVLWTGSAVFATWADNLQLEADKLSAVNGGEIIKVYFTAEDGAALKIACMSEGWPALASANPNEWGCVTFSGNTFGFTISAADAAAVKEYGMALAGEKITVTKIEVISASSETPSEPDEPVTPDTPDTPDTPAAPAVYSVTVSGSAVVTGDRTAGSAMTVKMPIGMAARVYSGTELIATIRDSGTFTMPAADVRIVVTDESGAGMLAYTAPNSYIFSYDSSMKLIKTTRSKSGISGTGEMTVKLGADYAGKTVTLYSGRNSTAHKIEEAVLDSKGSAAFTVEGAKNYTLVVED